MSCVSMEKNNYRTSTPMDITARGMEDLVWKRMIEKELKRQQGEAASKVIALLQEKALKGRDLNFVFLKVMKAESNENKNPELYIGGYVTWLRVLNDYDSWKEELSAFRSMNSNTSK